jgi:hypothetical protein
MIGVLGFDFRRGLGIFLFTTASRPALEPTQPPTQWILGAVFLGLKRPGREATTHLHLVPRSKNEWNSTSTPQCAFMAWCSVKKAQGQLYLYLAKHHAMKTYTEHILNLGTRWIWVVSFTLRLLNSWGKGPRCLLDMVLGRLHRWSGRGGEEKISLPCPCRESNPGRQARSLATILRHPCLFHVVSPRFRIRGAIPLAPPYTVKVWYLTKGKHASSCRCA